LPLNEKGKLVPHKRETILMGKKIIHESAKHRAAPQERYSKQGETLIGDGPAFLGAARQGDTVACKDHVGIITTGSSNVIVNGQKFAHVGDKINCSCNGDSIQLGSNAVKVNGHPAARPRQPLRA
jgi:uncharacterized Zn-binding protein involved in type VI secretion